MGSYRSEIRHGTITFGVVSIIGGGGGLLTFAVRAQFGGPRETLLFGGIILLQLVTGALFLRYADIGAEWQYAFLAGLGAGIIAGVFDFAGWSSAIGGALAAGLLGVLLFSGTLDPVLDPVRQ